MKQLTLNEEFRRVIAVVCEGIAEFRQYDSRQGIAVSISTSKGKGRFGVWAHVTPLRYIGGKAERRGRRRGFLGTYRYESPKLAETQPEALYLMTFLVPRFFALSPQERLETIVHELYHIHPEFRGDLRRFPGAHTHHGPTPAAYHRKVKSLTQEALTRFPELLSHPLIAGDGTEYGSHKRQRIARPRLVFRSEPLMRPTLNEQSVGSLWARALQKLGKSLLPMLLLASLTAQAVGVRTLRSGAMYASPSMKSEVTGQYAADTRFEAIRLSPTKVWVEVRGTSGKGWIPRKWVEATARASAPKGGAARGKVAPGAEPADEELFGEDEVNGKLEDRLEAFDAESDKYFANQGGRLFEKPSTMAARYGVVEKDDELKILKRSPDGQWSQVRLAITGEEGWFPSRHLRRETEDRVRSVHPNAVEAVLASGTKDHGFGLSVGYFRDVLRGGMGSTRPRDRIEIGGFGAYWMGSSVSEGEMSASVKMMQLAAMVRYLGSSNDGRFSGGGEVGIDYHRASISTSGISDTGVQERLIANGGSSIGFILGGTGMYAFTPQWGLTFGARAHLGSSAYVWLLAGTNFRF